MRTFAFCAVLLAPLLLLVAGCGSDPTENRTQKPKAGITDTSDPSKLVVPDQMKKAAPVAPKR